METDKILSIGISILALALSGYNYFRSRSMNMYQDLDRLYLDILKTALANPDFINPELTRDYQLKFQGDRKRQYDIYAFMVWNICETIYDRKSDKSFYNTWECVIKRENKLHGSWFLQPENQQGFKPAFIHFIKEKFPKP